MLHPFKIIPGDYVKHNGKNWYVIVRSIQDGESIMMATREDNHFSTTVIIPTPENSQYIPEEELNQEDYEFLSTQDYTLQAMYF